MKDYKGQIILSSLMTLSPILIGLLLWNRLPEQIVTHWDMKGTPDGSMGKALAVFLPPVLCLILHLFCAFITTRDSENKRQNRKIVSLCLWITPVIVLLTSCWVFAFALGTEFNLTMMLFAVIGIAFILIGNYMPKCRQNYFIGIKIIPLLLILSPEMSFSSFIIFIVSRISAVLSIFEDPFRYFICGAWN